MRLSDAVQAYIDLRDQRAARKKEWAEEDAVFEGQMAKIEIAMLKLLQDSGAESVRTDFGTVYTTTKSSASVADKELFLQWVRDNNEFAMLEIRPAKVAIAGYRQAMDDLPPGINWFEERTVNIRRSK